MVSPPIEDAIEENSTENHLYGNVQNYGKLWWGYSLITICMK